MYHFRHKNVFLILIFSVCIFSTTGKYNDEFDNDKSSSGHVVVGGNDAARQNTSFDLSHVLDRYRLDDVITKPTSSCVRIMFESILTAARTQSLSEKLKENYQHDYVVFCKHTTIENFISKSIEDKITTTTNGQTTNDKNGNMLSGIILVNIPLNKGHFSKWAISNNLNIPRNQLINATIYLSWTNSNLSSESFRELPSTFDRLTHLDVSDNGMVAEFFF